MSKSASQVFPLPPTLLCLAPLLPPLTSNDTMFCSAHHLFGGKGPCQLTHIVPSFCPLTLLTPLSLPLAPLSCPSLLSHSPHSLSLPLTPNGQTRLVVYYTIFRGPHHLCGGKGPPRDPGRPREVQGARGGKRE